MTQSQLGFQLAEQGAARALDKASRIHDDWPAMAIEAFRAYAQTHERFTTEDVRVGSSQVPTPPDCRAWGGIARRARNLRICVKSSMGCTSSLSHAHARPLNVWASLLYRNVL